MRNKKLRFEDSLAFPNTASLEDSLPELWQGKRWVQNDKLARAALKVAIRQELTARQRECIEMYFMERMTMDKISEKLGIGKSTVYKHIKTGKAHIRRVMAYADAFRAAMDDDDEE